MKVALIILAVVAAILLMGWIVYYSTHTKVAPAVPVSKVKYNSKYIVPYLSVLYPKVKSWSAFEGAKLRELYQSLNWYYLPLVDDVGLQVIRKPDDNTAVTISRRAPLAGPYSKQWTEAFLSDSTDQQLFMELPYKSTGKCVGVKGVDKVCDSSKSPCCDSGSICTKDGYCRYDATTAFCSVFPSTVPNSQGPTWKMGARACSVDEVGQTKVSSACRNKLLALSDDGKESLYGQQYFPNTKIPIIALDYQFISLYQPYGRKQGCPNFGYMEQVAYVCEGGGKLSLTAPTCVAPDPSNPVWVGAFLRNKFCGVECDPASWEECQKSANVWKKFKNTSNEATSALERVQFATGVQDRYELAERFTAIPGNLKGDNLGPAGCSFKNDWDIFRQTGVNGRGIWARKDNTLDGLINGHAEVDGKIPDLLTLSAAYLMNVCAQNSLASKKTCHNKTMYYWETGYGKFINLGRTGVYQNYIHFLLTVPNDPVEGVHLRSCLPEVLSMGVASSALTSLKALCAKRTADKRRTLSGFVTSFQKGSLLGDKYKYIPNDYSQALKTNVGYVYDFEATDSDWENKVIVSTGRMYWAKQWGAHVDPMNQGRAFSSSVNTWYSEYNGKEAPGVMNAGGLFNPQEGIEDWLSYILANRSSDKDCYLKSPTGFKGDVGLCCVASQVVQCYYPPNLRITNPNYRKELKLSLDDACILWQGMYIMGDSGGDMYGYTEGKSTCQQNGAVHCESFPFGTYFFSADIGSCVYAITAALGWNSSQFALMSTAGGAGKFCTYSGYDYEIVAIGDRNVACSNMDSPGIEDPYAFKTLDVTGGGNQKILDFYIKYGFIMGSSLQGDSESVDAIKARMQADKSLYFMTPFSSCEMPLNEQNVDTEVWGKKRPNMLFYDEPAGKCDWNSLSQDAYEKCVITDSPTGWLYQTADGEVVTGRDCPYADNQGAVRTQAGFSGYKAKFVPDWMLAK